MEQSAGRVAVSFDREEEAAEALKDAQRRFPGQVRAEVEDPVDRSVGGARRKQEAEDVIVGPSYAMTTEQAKQGALGMVVGAAALGILALVVMLPIVATGSATLTTAALIVAAGAFAGGTIGVIFGGRAGGNTEERRDERGHQRRVVVQIDTRSLGEAEAARQVLRAHHRPREQDARPRGPIEQR